MTEEEREKRNLYMRNYMKKYRKKHPEHDKEVRLRYWKKKLGYIEVEKSNPE